MYDYSPQGKTLVQVSTYGSFKLTIHFPTENEYFISWILFIRAYIDDLLVITKGDWTDHVHNMELKLNKLKGK